MITYDGHKWWTLCRLQGSVFPKASLYGLFFSIIAGVIKYLEEFDIVLLHPDSLFRNTSFFGSMSSTLAFFLIFRSSQAYSRFCQSSSSMCTMRAQFAEAASSLVAFTVISKAPKEDIWMFNSKIIRLFSMLHAACLEEIADQKDSKFPIIDGAGWSRRDLDLLVSLNTQQRVQMVYQWINVVIMKAMDSGVLSVPPPILSRVFQELEKGSIEFHKVVELMAIPFPFPYAQGSVVLLNFFSAVMPVVVVLWTEHWTVAFLTTFLMVTTMTSIELISAELEMPFGDDANDLPCSVFQDSLNESLLLLLRPESQEEPQLNSAMRHSEMCKGGKLVRSDTMLEIEQSASGSPVERIEDKFQGDTSALVEAGVADSSLTEGEAATRRSAFAASSQAPASKAEKAEMPEKALAALDASTAAQILHEQKEMHRNFLTALHEIVRRPIPIGDTMEI